MIDVYGELSKIFGYQFGGGQNQQQQNFADLLPPMSGGGMGGGSGGGSGGGMKLTGTIEGNITGGDVMGGQGGNQFGPVNSQPNTGGALFGPIGSNGQQPFQPVNIGKPNDDQFKQMFGSFLQPPQQQPVQPPTMQPQQPQQPTQPGAGIFGPQQPNVPPNYYLNQPLLPPPDFEPPVYGSFPEGPQLPEIPEIDPGFAVEPPPPIDIGWGGMDPVGPLPSPDMPITELPAFKRPAYLDATTYQDYLNAYNPLVGTTYDDGTGSAIGYGWNQISYQPNFSTYGRALTEQEWNDARNFNSGYDANANATMNDILNNTDLQQQWQAWHDNRMSNINQYNDLRNNFLNQFKGQYGIDESGNPTFEYKDPTNNWWATSQDAIGKDPAYQELTKRYNSKLEAGVDPNDPELIEMRNQINKPWQDIANDPRTKQSTEYGDKFTNMMNEWKKVTSSRPDYWQYGANNNYADAIRGGLGWGGGQFDWANNNPLISQYQNMFNQFNTNNRQLQYGIGGGPVGNPYQGLLDSFPRASLF